MKGCCLIDVPIKSAGLFFIRVCKKNFSYASGAEKQCFSSNFSRFLSKETGESSHLQSFSFCFGHQEAEFGAKTRVKEQEGGRDQMPLLDVGHLEGQNCPSLYPHTPSTRQSTGELCPIMLSPPFFYWGSPRGSSGSSNQWFQVRPQDGGKAMSMHECDSRREVNLLNPDR